MDGACSMRVGHILQERKRFKDAGTNTGAGNSNKIILKL
jgi:hypothetical protein